MKNVLLPIGTPGNTQGHTVAQNALSFASMSPPRSAKELSELGQRIMMACDEAGLSMTGLEPLNPDAITASADDSGCVVRSEVWSGGDCKVERTLRCATTTSVTDTVWVSRQMTEDGALLEGTFSASLSSRTNSCSSLYSLTMVRQ